MVNDLYSKPDRPNNNILEGNESVVCLPTFKGKLNDFKKNKF